MEEVEEHVPKVLVVQGVLEIAANEDCDSPRAMLVLQMMVKEAEVQRVRKEEQRLVLAVPARVKTCLQSSSYSFALLVVVLRVSPDLHCEPLFSSWISLNVERAVQVLMEVVVEQWTVC